MQPAVFVSSGNGRLGAEDNALDVDPEQLVIGLAKLVLVELGELGVDIEDAGVADENIEPAKGAHRLGDGALVVGEAGDVAGDADDLVAEFACAAGRPGLRPAP